MNQKLTGSTLVRMTDKQQKYVVTDPVTIGGNPAGPLLYNFIDFVDGDVVTILEDRATAICPDLVLARRPNDGLAQLVDKTCLKPLNRVTPSE